MPASSALRNLIETTVPRRPWCSQVKAGVHVRPLGTALQEPYIQLNPPCQVAWLVFDIDKPGGGLVWEEANLPPPTAIAMNPENGHAHVFYSLAAPVCTTAAARAAPLRYLAGVEHAYRQRLGADPGFAGRICKNPLHEAWKVWEPASCLFYELGDLAEYVTLPKRLPKREKAAGLGRNCSLFEDLRRWAYSTIRQYWQPGGFERWAAVCITEAERLNTSFPAPLQFSEVKGIGKSVARWTWRNLTPAGFRDVQAARGRLGGVASGLSRLTSSEDKRASAWLLAAQGMSSRAIAGELGMNQSTVVRWLR